MNFRLLFLVLFFYAGQSHAQSLRNVVIDPAANGKPLASLLLELEKEYSVDFLYDAPAVDALTVNGIARRIYISDFLKMFFEPLNLEVIKTGDNILFIVDDDIKNTYGNKRSFITLKPSGNKSFSIKGTLIDNGTGEPVVGAQVIVEGSNKGSVTDLDGNFLVDAPSGTLHQLKFQLIGYETTSYVIGFSHLAESANIKVGLFPESVYLEGVTITAEASDKNVQDQVTGVQAMNIETIRQLPTFMGEVDPVRSLTTFPGVSTVGELSSGFNVRGGETGQNLILQDGAIIFNPTHLFGFFSAFNPDLLKNAALYKGGGPANYGGRVSSVLDIKLRNGDAGKHSVSGGIGLISSRLAIEGPVIKNRSSYIIGGRISYSNWLLNSLNSIQLKNSAAKFYDITAKVLHRIDDNNYVDLSVYTSYDNFRLRSDSTFSWGTRNISAHWDHSFNETLVSTLTLASSNYFSQVANQQDVEGFHYENGINNIRMEYTLAFTPDENIKYIAGVDISRTKIEPGNLSPAAQGINVEAIDISDQQSLESAFYLQADKKINSAWAISAGLRYSNFWRLGSAEIYSFDYAQIQGRYPAITDTATFKGGELIDHYNGIEPRISLRYLFNENNSLKASYYKTYQYLHLVSNTVSTTPQDYWITSGPYIKPEIADQFSLGFFRNLQDDKYEMSVEGFYKQVKNTIDYIEGADVTLNKALEAGLVQGKGLAYGIEVLTRKKTGKISGWIAYTYSRSLRKFDSENELKNINNGAYYPSAYDQPHNLSLVVNYRLGLRSTLSSNFTYSTGRPITIPISKFSYENFLAVLNYSSRNEYRIPDYHRFDISLTIKDNPRRNRSFVGEWVFSVYNMYGRNNAYSVFFNRYGKAYKLSVLGNIFPSVTYNFKFNY